MINTRLAAVLFQNRVGSFGSMAASCPHHRDSSTGSNRRAVPPRTERVWQAVVYPLPRTRPHSARTRMGLRRAKRIPAQPLAARTRMRIGRLGPDTWPRGGYPEMRRLENSPRSSVAHRRRGSLPLDRKNPEHGCSVIGPGISRTLKVAISGLTPLDCSR